jgi:phosphatidylserine/phosphatidylglycerophosphate/cardiolipin synthase-like enzyme
MKPGAVKKAVYLAFFAVSLLFSVGCQVTGGPVLATNAAPTPVTSANPANWYTVYFTEPGSADARRLKNGPDVDLAAAIGAARVSVDAAIYDLDLFSIQNALIDAHSRGLNVRMVTESDYMDEEAIQRLIDSGIEVLGDRREGLMHNKFIVIDRFEVWTGSMNLTVNGAYRNNNNLIRIRSSRLAEDFETEFKEMFQDDKFGPGSPYNTPYPEVTIDGTLVEVYFSPDDGTASRILELLMNARQSIQFLAYSFTADDLGKAIIEQASAGLNVSGVMEESQVKSNIGTEYDRFHANGLDVRLDGNPANMHDKVIIIDGAIVITGSYNFSASAENSNDENTLIIHNPQIAQEYLAEFDRIFEQAQR